MYYDVRRTRLSLSATDCFQEMPKDFPVVLSLCLSKKCLHRDFDISHTIIIHSTYLLTSLLIYDNDGDDDDAYDHWRRG